MVGNGAGREEGREGANEAYLTDGVNGDLHLAHVVETVKDAVWKKEEGRGGGREGGGDA